MAKVSAHGKTIGTVEFNNTAKRYMSDGTILKNIAGSWKLHGKVKTGVTPAEAYASQLEKQRIYLEKRPALAEYRRLLHAMAGLGKRWKLHLAVSLMPDDCDGVWSEACDGYGDNVHADVAEVCELCAAYRVAAVESATMRPDPVMPA